MNEHACTCRTVRGQGVERDPKCPIHGNPFLRPLPPDPLVACLPADEPTPYTDNEIGACSRCHVAVQHRPHIPKPSRLICLECMLALAALSGDTVDICITPATMRDLLAYRDRN